MPRLCYLDCEGIAVQGGRKDDRNALERAKQTCIARFQQLEPNEQRRIGMLFLAFNGNTPFENGQVRAAHLPQCCLSDADLVFLTPFTELEKLDLFQSRAVTEVGLRHLAGLTNLRELCLSETGVDTIAPLRGLSNLRVLALNFVEELADTGSEQLGELTHLEELYLMGTNITDRTLRRLDRLHRLRKLALPNNGSITDDGIAVIRNFPRLEQLECESGRSLTNACLPHFQNLTQLRILRLGSGLTDEGLVHLEHLVELECLDLGGDVTRRGAEELAKRLPRVSIGVHRDIIKPPCDEIELRRKSMDRELSLLLPVKWHISHHNHHQVDEKEKVHFYALEDGYTHRFSYSPSSAPAELRLAGIHRTSHPSIRENLQSSLGSDGQLQGEFDADAPEIPTLETGSVYYRDKFGTHLIVLCDYHGKHYHLAFEAPLERVGLWNETFRAIVRSIRFSTGERTTAPESEADSWVVPFGGAERKLGSSDREFLRQIEEQPEDDEPRLAYADWLDEQNDPRGEFVRVQCELSASDDPDRIETLRSREEELLGEHRENWARHLIPFGVQSASFRRGMIFAVKISARQFATHGEDLVRTSPSIRQAEFTDLAGAGHELARSSALEHLTTVRIQGACGWGDPDLATEFCAFVGSEHTRNLTKLDLSLSGMEDSAARALASAAHLSELRMLNLHSTHFGDSALLELTRATHLRKLKTLYLHFGRGLTAVAGQHLATSPCLSNLERLWLCHTPLADDGIAALCTGDFANLRVLDLRDTGASDKALVALGQSAFSSLECLHINGKFTEKGVGAFVGNPALSNLQKLTLRGLDSRGIDHLMTSPHLTNLRHLDLAGLDGNDALGKLVGHERMNQIETLNVCGSGLTVDGLNLFANAPTVRNLKDLLIANNDYGDEGARVLIDSPYLPTKMRIEVDKINWTEQTRRTFRERFGVQRDRWR